MSLTLPSEYAPIQEGIQLNVRQLSALMIPVRTSKNQEITECLIKDVVAYKQIKTILKARSRTVRNYLLYCHSSSFQVILFQISLNQTKRLAALANDEERLASLKFRFKRVRELSPYSLLIINGHFKGYDIDDLFGIVFHDGQQLEFHRAPNSDGRLRPPDNFYRFCGELGLTLRAAAELYRLKELVNSHYNIFPPSAGKFQKDLTQWPYNMLVEKL